MTKKNKVLQVQAKLDGIKAIMRDCHHFEHSKREKFSIEHPIETIEPGKVWIISRNIYTRIMLPCKYHLNDYLGDGWEVYDYE